jgi:hypothetical protein
MRNALAIASNMLTRQARYLTGGACHCALLGVAIHPGADEADLFIGQTVRVHDYFEQHNCTEHAGV